MGLSLIACAMLAMAPTEAAAMPADPQTAAVAPVGTTAEPAQPVAETVSVAQDAAAPAESEAQSEAAAEAADRVGTLNDPLEPFNRGVYAFNNAIDRAALEPIARGYRAVTPKFFRTGVSNALANLGEPVTFANALLQGNINRAGSTVGRFAINSTFGLLGVLNPADDIGLERQDEDFGQTLGVWGVPSGPYLMLPLLGPSTLRDGAGAGVDAFISPWNHLDGEDMDTIRVAVGVTAAISGRAGAIEAIDNLRRTSRDPYVTVRSLYGQARSSAIVNGEQDVETLPDFGASPEADVVP